MHITDAQLTAYKKQGFLIVENFLTKDEQQAALDGFFTHFAPSYDQYLANDRRNDPPQQRLFPWDHSGLNHVTVHPDLIDAAERVLGTREIRLCEGHLGMKYAGEEYGTNFHIDYGNNTLGPIIEPDDFMNLVCFYCFDDVEEGMAPIRMVPKGCSDAEAVPMIVPGGSVCLYSVFTRHAASDFTALAGHRPVMWVGFTRKDRPYDGGRTFTYKSGAQGAAMNRFMAEATPRQRALLGFPPPGDPLWTEEFIAGMATRYPGFDPAPYRTARNDDAGTLNPRYVNRRVVLPYGLKVEEIEQAVAETYRLFHGLNDFLESSGFRPLEELLLGNSLSGMISEFLVKNIARAAETLEANAKVGGHPDLLPQGHYASNIVLKGDEGIEIKSSIQSGGWQGHNPEDCWLMVFRYAIGTQEEGASTPLTFLEILCAKLDEADWSFSGRTGDSRRTPTASITKTGVEKLRNNFIYRLPDVGVGRHRSILAEP